MNGIAPARPAAAPWRRWRDELGIAAVLVLLAAGVALGGWAWRLDRLVYDLGLALGSRPPPPDIVIVAIDDASVTAIGRWPWRRAVHATLLQQLAQARPRAVALDLVLSEPDPDPTQDAVLAAALARAAPVVLPVAWRVGAGPMLAVAEPTPALRAAVRLGAAESAVDADGVLRHAFLHAGPREAPYPHLALALLQAGGEAVHPDLAVQWQSGDGPAPAAGQRDGRLLVRYAGPPGTVQQLSYVDVLRGVVPPQRLAGRYVLVGMTAQGLGDTLATPVNGRHQAMPGIEVLANVLHTLRSGDGVRPLPDAAVAALSAVALVLLVATLAAAGPRRALPLALASVPLALAASLLALRGGLWASPVPYALSALLAYPLWSWRRLERVVGALDREIVRLDAAADERADSAGPAPAAAARTASDDDIARRLHTLRHAGAQLRDARRQLADALQALPTAMLVADPRCRVVLANARAAALFETGASDELLGLDALRLLQEFTAATPVDWAAALAALPAGGDGLAVEARHAGGGDHVVHVAAVQMQGERRLMIGIADIAPVKRAEREREEALAFVSHDLRSPASAIVLLAELNLQGREHTPRDELLHEVHRLAGRTLALSEDFVRAAHAQRTPLRRSPVRPSALLDEALAEQQAAARAAGLTLQVSHQGDDGERLLDPALVARAIVNLVANAIRHSPRGAVVELHLHGAPGRLLLAVRDHGPGLSAEQLAQLADGEQGAAAGDRRGVGLGLLFVQRVAARHGGRLRAAAADGGGALFELDIACDSGNP